MARSTLEFPLSHPVAPEIELMIARLDDLKPDAQVKGIVGREAVRIVSAEMLGDAACKVVYRGQDGVLGEQLLFRSSRG